MTASSFLTSKSLMTRVPLADPARLRRVPLDQGLDGDADLALDLRAHRDELAAQLLEELREVFFHEASLRGTSAAGAAGSVTVKRLPERGWDSTRIVAAVEDEEVLHDGEAEAGPRGRLRPRRVDPVEALEDLRLLARRDPDPAVDDVNEDLRARPPRRRLGRGRRRGLPRART